MFSPPGSFPTREEKLQQLRVAAPGAQVVLADSATTALSQIQDAEGFFGDITPEMLRAGQRLRWIQAPRAGLEHFMFPELMESPVTLTNMRGSFSDFIADHAFAFVLMFARRLHVAFRRQLQGEWNPDLPVVHLADSTLGIIGVGGIGGEVARRGAVSGMRVIGVDPRRTDRPEGMAELWGVDRLDHLLRESDFVVICAPHTPATRKLICYPQIRQMKVSAFLINIARGIIVDLADLTLALKEGAIAGAGLDVFETEPLPSGHPLWNLPNVLITPHSAGRDPHMDERFFNILLENIRRFAAGEPLLNIVDKQQWY